MSEYELRVTEGYPEHGILPGDQLKVRHQATAEPGQLVVAVIADEARVVPFVPGMPMLGLLLHVAGRRG